MFYTFCRTYGNNLLYLGYKNGRKVCEKIPFKPSLYLPSKDSKKTDWKSFYDESPLEEVEFDSIRDAKNFIESYKDVHGFEVHGFQRWEYQYLAKTFQGEITYDHKLLNIQTLDIEVVSETEDGFPDIGSANFPVVMISMHSSITDKTVVLGLKHYNPHPDDDFEYIQFRDEARLLTHFVSYTKEHRPDIWTGWNTSEFDIPYLVNRITRVLGEEFVKQLSPFGIIKERMIPIRGKEVQTYEIYGIIDLDMLQLYRKFGSYNAKESYALGFISQEELGETKLDMPGKTFRENYVDHFDLFTRYGAKDSVLVKKLNDKLNLIELAFTLAYMYKCNLHDVYKTVLPWETLINSYLHEHGIAFPPKRQGMRGHVEGAWVKEPKVGKTGWMTSIDFGSLYPSIKRQWNISAEKFIPSKFDVRPQDFLTMSQRAQDAIAYAKEHGYTLAANGMMFKKDSPGLIPTLLTMCMDGRKVAKDNMLELEVKYEETHDETLQPIISSLDNKQKALKVGANGEYGAGANEGFHFFDYRVAEAVTLTGQLSNMHMANKINSKFNEILGTEGVDYVYYADTDSDYIDCQALVDKFMPDKSVAEITEFLDKFGKTILKKIIKESIDEVYDMMNCYDRVMSSKREAIASKGVFLAKKKYALYVHNSEGVAYDPPKLKVMGIEIVRSSTPQWCRKKLKYLLQSIFETDEETFRLRFKDVEAEFMKLDVEDIAFPRGISDLDKYFDGQKFRTGLTIPIHVRATGLYNIFTKPLNDYPPIQSGDKIKFVMLKMPNPIKNNVIGFPTSDKLPKELKLHNYVDYPVQFEKTIGRPMQSIVEACGWKLKEEASLESFFG